jgi:quinol monooxygenase YgiN
MIIIAGEFEVKPELREDAVVALLRMQDASQAEAGCLAYEFYADLREPAIFFIYEAWADQSALDAHNASSHMAELRQTLPHLVAAPVKLQRYLAEPAHS